MKKSDKKEKKIENPNSKTVKNKEKKNKEKKPNKFIERKNG